MKKAATPETLGESNRMLILKQLRKHGNMSRADLSRCLGISFPAISSNVKSLIEAGYIMEVGAGDNSIGRKSTLLAFNNERGYVIGVDLGRFKTRVMMADLLGNSLASLTEPTETEGGAEEIINRLIDLFYQMIQMSGREKEKILCICIGTPGVVYDDKIVLAPFLPDFSASVLKERIAGEFSGEVMIENSVNMGAIGEKWKGAGTAYQNFLFINYGVGIGSALVLDGKLYKGTNLAAGEIGFMVSDSRNLRDQFDEVGVLENTIARNKIEKSITHGNFQSEVDELMKKYRKFDPYSRALLDEVYLSLGTAMINIATMLNLDVIIISGGLGISIGVLFQESWQELLKAHIPFPPKIIFSTLDNQEGLLGAVSVGMEHVHKMPTSVL